MFCKLDRAMVNQAWVDQFPQVVTHFMPEGHYDHCPIVVVVYPSLVLSKSPFKYFHMWSEAPNFQKVVNEGWNEPVQGCLMFKLMQKLKKVKCGLKKLNREGFSDLQCQEVQAYDVMIQCQANLQDDIMNMTRINEECEVVQNYKRIHRAYMSFLSQKAKVKWCKEGDDNTSIFHQSIRQIKLKNTVYAIHDDFGMWKDNL